MPKDYDAVSGYDKEREVLEAKSGEQDRLAQERVANMSALEMVQTLRMDAFACAELLGAKGDKLLRDHWKEVATYEQRRSGFSFSMLKYDGYEMMSFLGISSCHARWLLIDFGSELLLEECGEQLLEKVRG